MSNNNGKFGIINFSNNCYLNVIIQLFLYNKNSSNIIMNYLDILNNNGANIINPEKLMIKLSEKINVSRQNDSQEVFTLILDLIPDLEKYYVNKIKNIYTCQECEKSRTKEDTFSTFYIHTNSLEDSVRQVIANEEFELECDFCKKNTFTKKTCRINKLGNVLIFYNIVKNKLKITKNITFGSYKYRLTGIIKHFGNEKSGHYIFIDYINKLIIDDTRISKLDNLPMDDIYLLFYT
uniref:ubiquitinyl hydrolase 1 n=1 Tax=viral metagenome TaxID=1070528 RepID=A0A6C0LG97_9ZZZZ